MSNDRTLSGADEFLPILIYITIKASSFRLLFMPLFGLFKYSAIPQNNFLSTEKLPKNFVQANPPQLQSNLKFVQLFRRETKLISEVEYYLTNLISATMFIINVNAHSLSMEESEFQKHMELARVGTSSSQGFPTSARALQEEADITGLLINIFFILFGVVCVSLDSYASFHFTYKTSSFFLVVLSNNHFT
jgi:Rab5 GDP/GTP exchange factor